MSWLEFNARVLALAEDASLPLLERLKFVAIFANNLDENALVETLNLVEERGGKVFLCDSSLETGKQVSALGGMVALLRYDLSGAAPTASRP